MNGGDSATLSRRLGLVIPCHVTGIALSLLGCLGALALLLVEVASRSE